MCPETLVSLQLRVRAPTTVCARLEDFVSEDLSIIKVVLKIYSHICVLLPISEFTVFMI